MKNYILKAVSVKLEENNFVNQIPTELLKEKGLSIIPTTAYDLLIKKIKEEGNDNFTYISGYIEIIKLLYSKNEESLSSLILQSKSKKYKSIINLFYEYGVIKHIINGVYNRENAEKSFCGTYIMNHFSDLTFISLTEESDNVLTIDIKIDSLKNTPLDNDTFINTLTKSKIDASNAILAEYNFCKEEKKKYESFVSRVNAILNFLKYRSAGKGEKVNRVYSSFSSLSKQARKFVTYNGKHFYEIDIKNCQPLLLIILLIKYNLPIDTEYINAVTNGVFYESLQTQALKNGYDKQTIVKVFKDKVTKKFKDYDFTKRDDVKVLCYSKIFFTKEYKLTKIVKCFKQLYPYVYSSLVKLTETVTLAELLQNLEAEIVLNIIPNCPYFPVHDAIYITNKTEIEDIKTKIAFEIKKLSAGRIPNVLFGEIKEFEIKMIDKNDIDPEILIIKARASKLERAAHSKKDIRFNEFKELYSRMDKKSICATLKITDRTYIRYKKQLNK